MSWFEDPIAAVMLLPPFLVPLLVFGSALLEYVFPPWWGDTVILLGFFLAAQGGAPPLWIFAAAVTGSLVGSIAAYGLGRRYGMTIVQKIVRQRRRSESWGRTRELFQRFGERVLVINRFLPFVRGVMLYAAGALRMRFWPTVVYCGVSNLAFVALLMWLGLVTADSWERVLTTAQDANRWLGFAALVIVGLWIAVVLIRARRRGDGEGDA
ncbi:MAG: DedA family protein [Thermoanaerobaculia bacterium]